MKKIILLSFVMLMGIMNISAQDVQENIVKKTFLTSIHCPNCEARVKNNVAALGEGVKGVEVNLEKKEVTVEFDANKTNAENIIAGFEKINVKAQLLDGEKKCGGCKKAEGAEAKSCGGCAKKEQAEAKQCCKEKQPAEAEKKDCCKDKKDKKKKK